jgi:ABC-type nitrate/sulfonate/bicarbonate transport system permease component
VSAGSVVALLTAWYLTTEVLALTTPLVLPSPVTAMESGWAMLHTPYEGSTLLVHAWSSLQTVLGGWLLAVSVGTPLGLALGWSAGVRALIGPAFQLLRPIPPIAWIPLAIVWFGIGQPARFFVVFLAAVIPCVVNAQEGVRQVDSLLIRASRSLGASTLTTLRRVVLPSALPLTLTGVRISLGNAWMTLVGAELVAASSGLGFVLLNARRSFQPELIFVAMAVIGVLGAAMGLILRHIEPRLAPWGTSHGNR